VGVLDDSSGEGIEPGSFVVKSEFDKGSGMCREASKERFGRGGRLRPRQEAVEETVAQAKLFTQGLLAGP
jgi:hypothetical protein